MVCDDALCPSQQFFNHVWNLGCFHVFLGGTSIKQWIKCTAQGHNTMTSASLKLATIGSTV